jgi:hypothetical protein
MFDKKNPFGLKIHWCLTDDDALENLTAEETFVRDAVATAISLFGLDKARRLFLEELAFQTAKPARGKQPDKAVNEALLAEFDRKRASGLIPKAAVHAAAVAMKESNVFARKLGSVESTESRIWVLLRGRKDAQRAWAEYESDLAEYRKKLVPLLIEEIESEPKPH